MFFRNQFSLFLSQLSAVKASLKLSAIVSFSVLFMLLSHASVADNTAESKAKTTCTDPSNPHCLCRPEILGFPNNKVEGQNGKVLPIVLEADNVEAQGDKEVTLSGTAFVAQGRQSIGAEKIVYDRENDKVKATGNVEVRSVAGDLIQADAVDLEVNTSIGDAKNAKFKLVKRGVIEEETNAVLVEARGSADTMSFEGKDFVSLQNVAYTNCVEGQDDFFIKAKQLELDHATGMGTASSAKLVFKGVPFFYFPRLTFPITDQRKSGFLFPIIGKDSKSGFVFGAPWYWNISPNMDATITPKIFTDRGVQVGLQVRHISKNSKTELNTEVLPSDNEYGDETRSLFSLDHVQEFSDKLTGKLDINDVSDVDYFSDFRNDFDTFSTTYTPSEARIDYVQKNWRLGARVVTYEVVDPAVDEASKPADILPQVTFSNRYNDINGSGFNFRSTAQSTTFKKDGQDSISRLTFIPSIERPFETTWGYTKPKFSINYADYSEEGVDTRTAPIFSVDSGLYFERRMKFAGENALQTLEPRLFYVNADSDANNAPTLDTTALAFNNFSDLFSETGFTGGDGVADGQRLTFALATRIYNKEGDQKLKAQIGQSFYLDDLLVQVNGVTEARDKSDTLLEIEYKPANDLTLNAFFGYGEDIGELRNTNFDIRYQPAADKYIKFAYRSNKHLQSDSSLSEQSQFVAQAAWPLSPRWKGFATQRYDLDASENIQTQIGAEYDSCCWKLKLTADKLRIASDDYRNTVLAEISFTSLGAIKTSF